MTNHLDEISRAQPSRAPDLGALTALSLAGDGSKLARLIQAGVIAERIYRVVRGWYDHRRSSSSYSIRVSSRDNLYPDIHRWLLDQMPESDRRSLAAISTRRDVATTLAPSDSSSPPQSRCGAVRVRYQYDGKSDVRIWVCGHPITVSVEREPPGRHREYEDAGEQIVFSATTLGGRDVIRSIIEALADRQVAPELPRVFIAKPWGDWARRSTLAPRDPASVVLAAGVWERLSADLAQFLASEALYARVGAPWHRGYLLHGPPGTGKTTTALALAYQHRLDVYYLPLSDMKSDTNLIELVSSVPDRSILLIEDIDVSNAATTLDDTPRASAQGLLNSLDGAITPHGLVVIATTNHLNALNEALVRAGRFDVVQEIGYLTDEQLARLVSTLTGASAVLPPLGGRSITAATVSERVKAHITDMDAARAAVSAYLLLEELCHDSRR